MDFLEHEIEEILNIFREESEEQLQKLNKNLLTLESNPKDYAAITELFREAHSLKGSARMIGLNDIQSIAHKLEDIFGMAKDGELEVTSEVVDSMCRAVDCINSIVNESIKTRGKAEFPEIREVLNILDKVLKNEKTTIISEEKNNQSEENTEHCFADKRENTNEFCILKLNKKEIDNLITHIKVNIEKIKVFSTSSDALGEFLFFIDKLSEYFNQEENSRLKGLLDDIRLKIDISLKGSGILVPDEVQEIEEIFEIFLKFYERATFVNRENRINIIKPQEAQINQELQNPEQQQISNNENNFESNNKQESFSGINSEEKHNEDWQNPALEKKEKDTEDNALKEKKQINYNDISYIRNNINVFSNHTEENAAKFEEIILKLNSLTAAINEDHIRQILERISDLLSFSREKEAPVNQDMIKVLEESFDDAVTMLSSEDEPKEDPSLIVHRITVLHQMLKFAIPEEVSKTKPSEEDDKNQYFSDISQGAEKQYSPVKSSTNIYSKKKAGGEDQKKQTELKFSESNTIKTLRVDTQKLDHLVNQAGELIIAKIKAKEHLSDIEKMIRYIEEWHRDWTKTKQYFRYANKYIQKSGENPLTNMQYMPNKNINSFIEENSIKITNLMNKMNSFYKVVQEDDARLNLIVSGLEEKIKSVRVLPLATIFHLFPRMVRDIARDRNKEVEFFITGSETSVDKKIIEEIKSPLMHIIRNSIDHGIETPKERISRGKPYAGKLLLAAYHLENSVLIEITDDGKGIDVEGIKKKVLQKELLTKEELEAMSEEQIMNIIFWPGFSTGETVTDISGRGIGLDIVHTKISQLNGNIKVKSNLGKGSRVSLQIPVTMATINSFLVETNNQTFAIPANSIKTTLLVDESQVFYKEGERAILVEERSVPLCQLSDVLEMPGSGKKTDKLVVIIVQAEDAQVGFIVDKLIGDHEILHKNLSAPLLRVRNIAGITTLGSGDLCLILNVNDLVKSAYIRFGSSGLKKTSLAVKTTPESEKKSALVIDDSATARILQRNILKSSGYNVDVAVNGFDALTKIASNKYDFIVTDAEMPEMDGFELTERLRQEKRYQTIPIIIVTSLTSEEDRVKGMNSGANAYITKGKFDQEELLKTIRTLID